MLAPTFSWAFTFANVTPWADGVVQPYIEHMRQPRQAASTFG